MTCRYYLMMFLCLASFTMLGMQDTIPEELQSCVRNNLREAHAKYYELRHTRVSAQAGPAMPRPTPAETTALRNLHTWYRMAVELHIETTMPEWCHIRFTGELPEPKGKGKAPAPNVETFVKICDEQYPVPPPERKFMGDAIRAGEQIHVHRGNDWSTMVLLVALGAAFGFLANEVLHDDKKEEHKPRPKQQKERASVIAKRLRDAES